MRRQQRPIAVVVLIFTCLLVATGCSKTSGPSPATMPPPSGVSPQERWPQTGPIGYKLGGSDCGDVQTFTRKADYCIALRDHSGNHSCTLDARKALYKNDCGSDFEEENIPSKIWASYDPRLDRECSTAPAPTAVFDRQDEACAFLKNESIHRGCLWDQRRDEFNVLECDGDFSPAPSSLGQYPTPNPGSTPTPSPTPALNTRPQVARDLDAIGIKVDVHSDINVDPLHPFASRLAKFWPELASVQNDLIARKKYFAHLTLSEYTAYDAPTKTLHMSVDLDRNDLALYLALFDRRAKWEKSTGIVLDLGVEIYGFETDKTALLRERVSFLEQNQSALTAVKAALRTMKFDTDSSFSFENRRLTVRYSEYQKAIAHALRPLAKAATLFGFADAHRLALAGDFALDNKTGSIVADHSGELEALLAKIGGETKALGQLRQLDAIDRLQIDSETSVSQVDILSKTLAVATTAPGLELLSPVVRAFAAQAWDADTLSVDVFTSLFLDANYLIAESRLEQRLAVLKTKVALLTSIELGETSSFADGALVIGYTGTLAELDAAIEFSIGSRALTARGRKRVQPYQVPLSIRPERRPIQYT